MLFAFSRDGAVPGGKYWRQLNANKVPVYGVAVTSLIAILVTLPALVKVNIPGIGVEPIAFFAVVTIGVIGLYLAFAVPIFYRLKAGDSFVTGQWSLGSKYKWMCTLALIEIAITSIIALLPTSSGGIPWHSGFAMKYVNYTILVVPGALLLLWIYWHASVKNWFKGPVHTIELPDGAVTAD
jgi:hypothetical protein